MYHSIRPDDLESAAAVEPLPPADRTIAGPQPGPVPPQIRPDPDFAVDPFPAARLPADFPLRDHQRLIVNPFLAVIGLIVWAWLTRHLYFGPFPPLALLPFLFLFWLPFSVHYHCLDCGQTGVYPRWWQHACPKTLLRSQLNRPRWFRWPTARSQLIVWSYILGAVALLLAVLGTGAALIWQ